MKQAAAKAAKYCKERGKEQERSNIQILAHDGSSRDLTHPTHHSSKLMKHFSVIFTADPTY